jgi:hypothetical protein
MNTWAQAHARERSEPPELFSPARRRAARRAARPPHAQLALGNPAKLAQRAPGHPARPAGVSKRGSKKSRGRK